MSQGRPFSLYTYCLLDLILNMVIFYTRKPENNFFQNKLERVQYKACLSIIGAIQRTSRVKLYDELGLHSQSK